MNRIEPKAERSTSLSGALFDKVLTPLATSRRDARSAPYFPKWREAAAESYFTRSSVSTMSAADFEFPGGGTSDGLMDALVALWTAEGETELAATGPRLKAIAQALRDEAVADDGSVDIFCYTLF
jgi:hypothetical protein